MVNWRPHSCIKRTVPSQTYILQGTGSHIDRSRLPQRRELAMNWFAHIHLFTIIAIDNHTKHEKRAFGSDTLLRPIILQWNPKN